MGYYLYSLLLRDVFCHITTGLGSISAERLNREKFILAELGARLRDDKTNLPQHRLLGEGKDT